MSVLLVKIFVLDWSMMSITRREGSGMDSAYSDPVDDFDLDAHIDWVWFVVSQITFGVVAGLVVARAGKIRTSARVPFFARMGIEAPGLMESNPDAGPPHVRDKGKH